MPARCGISRGYLESGVRLGLNPWLNCPLGNSQNIIKRQRIPSTLVSDRLYRSSYLPSYPIRIQVNALIYFPNEQGKSETGGGELFYRKICPSPRALTNSRVDTRPPGCAGGRPTDRTKRRGPRARGDGPATGRPTERGRTRTHTHAPASGGHRERPSKGGRHVADPRRNETHPSPSGASAKP